MRQAMTEMPIENEFVDPVRAAAARMHRIHFLDDATPPRQRSSTVTIPQPMPKSTAVTDDYPFPEDSDEDKFENAHVAKASSDTNTAQSTTSKSSSSRQPSEAARPQPSRIPQKNAPSSSTHAVRVPTRPAWRPLAGRCTCAPPMQTDASASLTCGAKASTSEYTATVR